MIILSKAWENCLWVDILLRLLDENKVNPTEM